MSEWLDFVKAYATKHNISYKQALRDASPSYKTRNEKKPEATKPETRKGWDDTQSGSSRTTDKTKRKYNKKVVENITLKL